MHQMARVISTNTTPCKVMQTDKVKVIVETNQEGSYSITPKYNWFLSTERNKLFKTDGSEEKIYKARRGNFVVGVV